MKQLDSPHTELKRHPRAFETPKQTAIVVEDNVDCRLIVERILSKLDVETVAFGAVEPALRYLASKPDLHPSLIITDLSLPDADGLDLVRKIKSQNPYLPMIVMTAYASVNNAVEALRLRVDEFVEKPLDTEAFQKLVGRFLDLSLTPESISIPNGHRRDQFLIGSSSMMRTFYRAIEAISQSSANVLLSGESGTGKELAARAIHTFSERKDGPFVAVNCGAIPEGLFESELFGHTKGAFTGAIERRTGLFEEAHGGTLFLDEVGELSPHMQVKLLRVLQDHTVRPVGSNSARKVDVRVIAATNKDLQEEVAARRFRPDLFYRLNIFALKLPSLRDRHQDIPLLAYHFLDLFRRRYGLKVEGFSSGALKKLMSYRWPGNIRQLENVIERAVVFTRQGHISEENILIGEEMPTPESTQHNPEDFPNLKLLESEYIDFILTQTTGRKEEAARVLGIDRKTLHRKRARPNPSQRGHHLHIDFHRLFKRN